MFRTTRLFALAVALLAGVATASGAVVNVDFQPFGSPTHSGQGAYSDLGNDLWNGFALGPNTVRETAVGPITSARLADSAGNATTTTVTVSDGPPSGGFVVDGSVWGSALVAPALFDDYWYTDIPFLTTNPLAFSIDNLVAGNEYDIYVYAAQPVFIGYGGEITIGGVSKTTAATNPAGFVEDDNYVFFSGVTAGDGTITGTVSYTGTSNPEAAMNGVTIVGEFEPFVPKPNSGIINVDFNDTGGATYSGQGAVSDVGNDLWNGVELGLSTAHEDPIGDPDGPVASAALLESDGSPSLTTVTINNGYVADSSLFGAVATFAPDLFNDSVYEWGAVPITFSIDGLVDGALYDIYLYSDGNGWRDWGAYAGRFTIDGVTQDANPVYAPAGFVEGENYVLFSDVVAVGGTIAGTVDEVPGGNDEGELEWHGLTIVSYLDMVWDGGPGDWTDLNWSGGKAPTTGLAMVIDHADGNSDVTVAADFDAARSVAIGQNNAARLAIDPAVALSVDNEVTVGASGTLQVDGILTAGGELICNGTLTGSGLINGHVFVAGTASPGSSTGHLTVFGTLEFDTTATLDIEIDGAAHDKMETDGGLVFNADIYLAGNLAVTALKPMVDGNGNPVWGDKQLTILEIVQAQYEGLGIAANGSFDGTIPTSYGLDATVPADSAAATYLGAGLWFGNASDDPAEDNGVYLSATKAEIGVFQAAPGDTDGNRKVEGQDILNVLQAGLFGDGVTPEANWGNGDFNADGKISGEDILALLGTGLFGDGTYPDSAAAAAAADVKLVVTGDGLVIDPGGATVTGFVLSSESGILTGDDAATLGLFQEDTDATISGAFAMSLKGEHALGDVIGQTDVDLGDDLTLAYTIAGVPGVFTASVVVPEPGTLLLLISGLAGLLIWRRRRRA